MPSRNVMVMKGNFMNTFTRRGFLGASAAALALIHPAARAALEQHHGSATLASDHLLPLEAMPKGQHLSALSLLKNQSGTKGVFRARIVAKPMKLTVAARKATEFWLYNGHLPGPQIVAREGDTVEILFENQLPEPTLFIGTVCLCRLSKMEIRKTWCLLEENAGTDLPCQRIAQALIGTTHIPMV